MADFLRAGQQALNAFYEAVAQAPVPGADDEMRAWLQRLAGGGAAFDPNGDPFAAMQGHPLLAGLERVFVGSSDALGLGPASAMRRAAIELAQAEQERRRARDALFGLYTEGWAKVTERVHARLGAMAAAGETIDSVMALLRLWAAVATEVFHDVLQSERGLSATAAHMRALARHKRARERVVSLACREIGVPTREEVDEAYRMLVDLKRELRATRKAQAANAGG